MAGGGLRSIGGRIAAAALAGAIGFSLIGGATAQAGPGPQTSPVAVSYGGPTVVVTGWGTATAPADGAIVQLVARQLGVADSGASGSGGQPGTVTGVPTPPKKNQVDAVMNALVNAGLSKAATAAAIVPEGPYSSTFGQGVDIIAFKLDASQIKKIGKYIDIARKSGEEAGISYDAINLVYTVADCNALANASMNAAIANGKAQADLLAPALGFTLGELLQAASLSSYGKYYAGGNGGTYCSQPITLDAARTTYLSPYDPTASAEVVIYSSISLTYALK